MKNIISFVLSVVIVSYACMALCKEAANCKPPLYGWYEGSPESLMNQINSFFSKIKEGEVKGKVWALIVPHAGYRYSGQAAAYGYKLLQNQDYQRIIIIGPSHYVGFYGISFSKFDGYKSPLGTMEIDQTAYKSLSQNPLFTLIEEADEQEHSIAIQVPFLQKTVRKAKIVPLIVGDLKKEDYQKVAESILSIMDDKTLIVVSSDFTHYGFNFGYIPFSDNIKDNIRKLDFGAIDKIIDHDFKGFLEYQEQTGATICGYRPVAILLKMLPKDVKGEVLKYYTSGDLIGDYRNSVSYACIGFFK
ncbi:MAG TPA: AmmeMemoRadiSam system protein B [Syntrophaceae bacterium]|nr:AmmeMemoRadiSam system protein B [Syntrophaceae bacterium]